MLQLSQNPDLNEEIQLRKEAMELHGKLYEMHVPETVLPPETLTMEIKRRMERIIKDLEPIWDITIDRSGWDKVNNLFVKHAVSLPIRERLEILQSMTEIGKALDDTEMICKPLEWGGIQAFNQGYFLWGALFTWKAAMIYKAEGNIQAYVRCKAFQADCYRVTGKPNKGKEDMNKLLGLKEVQEDSGSLARIYYNLGGIAWHNEGSDSAIGYFEAAIRGFRQAGMEKEMSDAHLELGTIYKDKGQWEIAMEHFQICKATMIKLYGENIFGTIEWSIGDIYMEYLELDKALETYQEGVRIAEKRGDHFIRAMLFQRIAKVKVRQYDYESAEFHAREAMEYFKQIGSARFQTEAEETLLEIQIMAQQYGEGKEEWEQFPSEFQERGMLPYYQMQMEVEQLMANGEQEKAMVIWDRAIRKAKDDGLPRLQHLLIDFKGQLLLNSVDPIQAMGNFKEAEDCFQLAIEYFRSIGDSLHLSASLCNLGYIKTGRFQYAEAESLFLKSMTIDEAMGVSHRVQKAYLGLAGISVVLGEKYGAYFWFDKAVEAADEQYFGVQGELGRAQLAKRNKPMFGYILQSLTLLGVDKKAFDYMSRSKGNYLSTLTQEAAIPPETIPEELWQERKDILKRIEKARTLLNHTLNTNGKNTSQDLNRALNELRFWEERVRQLVPEFELLEGAKPVTTKQFESVLEPGEAVIEFLASDWLYVLVSSREGMELITIADLDQIQAAIQNLRQDFIEKGIAAHQKGDLKTLADLGQAFQKNSHYLYKSIWRRVEKLPNMKGVKKVTIIPDGQLSFIPFEMLVRDPEIKPFNQFHYLIHDYDFRYYSSSGSLYNTRNQPAKDGCEKDWLGIGMDDLSQSDCDPGLNDLIGTEQSLQKIANHFPKDRTHLMLGKDASETELRRVQPNATRILHIAGHGILNDQNPELCHMVLNGGGEQDGCLHLYEVYKLALNPETVILAGCETGIGKDFPGEGMASMLRGFRSRKAKNVLLSLWKLDSHHSNIFFEHLYGLQKKREPGSFLEPLMKTKRAMIKSEKTAFPFLWAGIVCFGDG